jgi:hypothetical protein
VADVVPGATGEVQSTKKFTAGRGCSVEYDLINLFDHPICLFEYIPATIVTLSTGPESQCSVQVELRRSANEKPSNVQLVLKWDLGALRLRDPLIDRRIQSRRERDEDRATRTEETAIVVGVAVLAQLEPDTRVTFRSRTGSGHDYYLNDTREEMIEMAGEWVYALPSLFNETQKQSDQNASLRKRWVSVTVMRETPRNRTEGLHE